VKTLDITFYSSYRKTTNPSGFFFSHNSLHSHLRLAYITLYGMYMLYWYAVLYIEIKY